MNTNLVRSGCVMAVLVAASGCLGGGNGNGGVPTANPPPPPPSPSGGVGGLWTGAITWGPNAAFPGGALNVRALMTETGEFRWILSGTSEQFFGPESEQVFGQLTAVDHGVQTSTDLAIWMAALGSGNPFGGLWGRFGMEGMYSGRDGIGATFWSHWNNQDERWGDVSLDYDSLYERDSSLAVLAGTFVTDSDSLTIDSLGAIFYQSSREGCTGNGSAEVIDPDFNMYRMSIELENCITEVRNGLAYTGLAYIGESNDLSGGYLNDTIEIALSASYDGGVGTSAYIPWSLLAHKQ
jgi:hypothetical protein